MPAAPADPRLRLIRQRDTHRLVPSRYRAPESVLARIADDDRDLRAIFDLEQVTNDRLLAEQQRLPEIGPHELVFGVPSYHVINAAFCHAHPLGARFSGRTVARGTRRSRFGPRRPKSHSIDQSNWLKSNGSTKRSRPTTTTWRISVVSSTTSDGIGVSPTPSIPTATRHHKPSGSDSSTGDGSASSIRVSAGQGTCLSFPAGGRCQRSPDAQDALTFSGAAWRSVKRVDSSSSPPLIDAAAAQEPFTAEGAEDAEEFTLRTRRSQR